MLLDLHSGTLSDFFPVGTEYSHVISLELFLGVFLIFTIAFTFFLSPGGFAWAISRPTSQPHPQFSIPGPSGLPLIGLVPAFTGTLTHRALDSLSRGLGARKLMAFSVGFTRFVISSDPETAKEILNSSAFTYRPMKETAYELLFHRAMGFAPFSEYWRNLRRISASHLFSPRKIASLGEFRSKIGLKMVDAIREQCNKESKVEVRKILHLGSLNNVMMSVSRKSYDFSNGQEGKELENLVSEGYELLGMFNWSDHFPILGWFDLQGVRKRCRKLVAKVNLFVKDIIEEHRIRRKNDNLDNLSCKLGFRGDEDRDFVDVLLDLEEENKLSASDMIAVLWVGFCAFLFFHAFLLDWISIYSPKIIPLRVYTDFSKL